MKFWLTSIIILVGTISILVGFAIFVTCTDLYARYDSWRTLDATTIRGEAIDYVERYRIDHVGVCVYSVNCDSAVAILTPIPNLEDHDFDLTRELIWARRFYGECTGRTANIGLHLVALEPELDPLRPYEETAWWSFGTDRFLRRSSSFSSGSFSVENWERCSPKNFAFTRIDGAIEEPRQ